MDDTNPASTGKNTDLPEAASTSSTPTGESPHADPVAALGERILADLGEAETNDTLTRWLSHYTARLISEADSARDSGDPAADALEVKARDAILDLWQARTAWPTGWPPSQAAEITRLLDQLPALDDEIGWYGLTQLGRLHAIHYQILAALVDLAIADNTDVEQAWLDKYGEHLTPDEKAVLHRVAEQPRRVEALLRWKGLPSSSDQSGVEEGAAQERAPGNLLRQLADAYHATITALFQGHDSEAEDDPRAEEDT